MRRARFVIPGKPVGYVATTRRGKWKPEYQRFAEYAKHVRMCARAAGIHIPVVSTKRMPLTIRTIAYFPNGVHCDPGNVQKGVVDALFYDEGKTRGRRKGDDKYTGGSFPPPLYDKENPRVVVIIKDYERKENGKRKSEHEEKGKA